VRRLVDDDFNWHDGVLVDPRFAEFGGMPEAEAAPFAPTELSS
jgi:hypothetical protein